MGAGSSLPELSPLIETNSGPLRGKVLWNNGAHIVDGYLGIPYAQPPTGELRFQKPVPVEAWKRTRDCFEFGPRAPQKDEIISKLMTTGPKAEADCLTLNVVAPRSKSKDWPSGYPVMVWIHGGGFTLEGSSRYGDVTAARNFCVNDVIFVSLNYRLGILGFFCTGDDRCRGNFGLWDQTLGLKWVKENIQHFGGDPDNITLFGQSAGGVSVDLLSISPHSRDMIQKAIPMAHTAESQFLFRSSESLAKIGREYARSIGWKGEDPDTQSLFDFMKKQPIPELEFGLTGFKFTEHGNLPFVPNLDGDFFPAPLSQLRKDAPKRPLMTGTTEFEGITISFLTGMGGSLDTIKKFLDKQILEADYGHEAEALKKKVVDFYLKDIDCKNKKEITKKYIEMVGDYCSIAGTASYCQTMSELGNDVYLYSFDYCNPDGFGLFGYAMPFKAATHCSELRYVLGKGVISKFKPNHDDLKMLDIMTTYFTNFAKYGDPNGKKEEKWRKFDPAKPAEYFKIILPKPEIQDGYQQGRGDFWNKEILPRNQTRSRIM